MFQQKHNSFMRIQDGGNGLKWQKIAQCENNPEYRITYSFYDSSLWNKTVFIDFQIKKFQVEIK